MLGSYMEDIGITPKQFEEACGQGTGGAKKQFQQGLFEQASFNAIVFGYGKFLKENIINTTMMFA